MGGLARVVSPCGLLSPPAAKLTVFQAPAQSGQLDAKGKQRLKLRVPKRPATNLPMGAAEDDQ